MKATTLTLILALTFLSACKAQPQQEQNENDREQINSIFDKIELQGVSTNQNLLYGYFFFDKDKIKLENLKDALLAQSYKFVELTLKDNDKYMLHVEKIETHTRQSLQKREQNLRTLAEKYQVSSFDGFDIGNANPTKALISTEGFSKFMATKKGNELFDLGIKLYDLNINDKAVLVFKECIHQNIKPDTSAYKLGNSLIDANNVEQGIEYLIQATKYNPDYLSAFFNLGASCYDNHKFQESILYYQQADRLKPNDDQITYGIAASQYAVQQYDESLANCRKALALNKDNGNAKKLLQMLYGKTH